MKAKENKISAFNPVTVLAYSVLILGGFVMLYPFIFTFLGSLLTKQEYLTVGILPLPKEFSLARFENLIKFFMHEDVWGSIGITLIRFTFYAITNTFFAMLGGFIFAKINFKGKTVVFYYMMISMMVPGVATMLPSYIMMAKWPLVGGNDIFGQGGSGFVGIWPVLFVGGWFGAYNMFLVRQAIYEVGNEIGESAEIDGAGYMRVIFTIYMPLMRPVISVLLIGMFIGNWNDYLFPMTFMNGTSTPYLVPIGYKVFDIISRAQGTTSTVPNYPAIFGVCFTAMLPPVLVFVLLQKHFITGLSMGAVKG